MSTITLYAPGLTVEVVDIPAPAPSPAPDPAPAPAPAPSPAPVTELQQLNMGGLVAFKGYIGINRYERHQRLQVYDGDRAEIPFHAFTFTTGGTQIPFRGSRYGLLVNGVELAVVNVLPGSKEAVFDLDLIGLETGWKKLEITGLTDGETCPTWFAFVKRGTVGEQPFTPVVRGTYEIAMSRTGVSAYALAPGRYAPRAAPLTRREYTPFDSVLQRGSINCTQLVPHRHGDIRRPNVNKDGVQSSFDTQAYHWYDMVAKMPKTALLDGPRGVGTLAMTTHVEIGKAAPDGRPRNNLYACDPWRVCKVAEDGTIKTLVGYRHREILSYWQDPAQVELVGDWSAVPEERRGFHELWGMAWDERSLTIDESAPRIPEENNDKPHLSGPVMFLADSQNNRICKVEFSATSHTVAPKVTEFVPNSADAWDVVYYDGVIYVTERKAHRIAAYDATTGEYLRTVIQGRALANVDKSRFIQRGGSLETLRAEPCVAPEGLYKLPDDPWLYFASFAQAQVRRVHLVTGELQVVCDVPINGNSIFCKIAVGDGSFGPRGTVFVWSWQNGQYGFPYIWLPEGSTFKNWQGAIREWKWYEGDDGYGQWSGFQYATAGAVGQGRLVCGGVEEGLLVLSRAQLDDLAITDSIRRGGAEFSARGLDLLHGHHGFGFYGLPLPWGVSADIDAYLEFYGHAKPNT